MHATRSFIIQFLKFILIQSNLQKIFWYRAKLVEIEVHMFKLNIQLHEYNTIIQLFSLNFNWKEDLYIKKHVIFTEAKAKGHIYIYIG